MAWTQTQIDALKDAIARGVRKVVFVSPGGVRREQEYATLDEMRAALTMMQREASGVSVPAIRRTVGVYRSGL